MQFMKRISLIMSVIVLLLLNACNRAPAPAKIGQKLDYKGFELTVLDVRTANDFPGARKARAGYNLVAVQVAVENTGGRSGAHWDPLHTRLIDRTSGAQHKAHTTGMEPQLNAMNDLAKGQPLKGWVTFEVPDNSSALNFEYELPTSFDHVILKVQLDKG